VVSISGCDPLDPGSNPGTAIFFIAQKLCAFFGGGWRWSGRKMCE
jgi:hypothetical protein